MKLYVISKKKKRRTFYTQKYYTTGRAKLVIIGNTHKIQSLFNYSCVIYDSVCSCSADYIGETIRNSEIRWKEHSSGKDKDSDSVKNLNDNFDHEF